MQRHIKQYNNLVMPYQKFIKKCLLYANPSSKQRVVKGKINSPYVKLKQQTITIGPYSSGSFKLRMYFQKTAGKRCPVTMQIIDQNIIEELHFNFDLRE